jgi:hypothetical protein
VKRERRQPTRREREALTLKRPVAWHIDKEPRPGSSSGRPWRSWRSLVGTRGEE